MMVLKAIRTASIKYYIITQIISNKISVLKSKTALNTYSPTRE